MLGKIGNLRNQPCCGYFLQGGVRAVAILDIGISLFAMILIGSELVKKFQDWVDMRKDETMILRYYVRAVLWASYFAVKIIIIGLSIFLFKNARRRNGGMCRLWIYLTIGANTVLVSSALSTQLLFGINPLILIFLVGYIIYKLYAIHVVATFIAEIKSYGGFNAALSGLTDAEVEEFERGNPPEVGEGGGGGGGGGGSGGDKDPLLQSLKKQAYNTQFEIPFHQLQMDESTPLGSGAYGTVYRATISGGGGGGVHSDEERGCGGGRSNTTDNSKFPPPPPPANSTGTSSSTSTGRRTVAVKTVHSSADPAYFKALLGELKIMTFLPPQENIVNLIGACTSAIKERRLYIVVEFCPFGNLHDYLKARRGLFVNYVKDGHLLSRTTGEMYRNVTANSVNSVTTSNLFQWGYETAKGMQFLEDKKVIHGDLAARNLLLGYGRSIKITDFGLSKKLYQYTNYVKKQDKLLPWRWMSIESLRDMKFSSKSDTWSYGVVLWEIFSLAEVPFPGFSWTLDFINQIDLGLRMKQPPNATHELYELMLQTWELDEEKRPNFSQIRCWWEEHYTQHINPPPPSKGGGGGGGGEGEGRSKDGEEDSISPHPFKGGGGSKSSSSWSQADEVEVYIGNAFELAQVFQNEAKDKEGEDNTTTTDLLPPKEIIPGPTFGVFPHNHTPSRTDRHSSTTNSIRRTPNNLLNTSGDSLSPLIN